MTAGATSSGTRGLRVALCGIVKNEAAYLIDWIAWHRALGFTDFIIADNDSTDGTAELLAQLQARHALFSFPMPARLHRSPQLDAYAHAAALAARLGIDWIAFFDADEFLLPATPTVRLPALLQALPEDCGALAVNWAVYGSSGQFRAGPEPVPYRFTERAPLSDEDGRHSGINQHYKSVIRPKAFAGRMPNPHHMDLKPGFRYCAADGTPLAPTRPGLATPIMWEPFRLNHYIVRSWGEFVQKKLPRGLADNQLLARRVEFFHHHDLGGEHEPVPAWIRPAFEARRDAVLALLKDRSVLDRAVDELLAFEPPPIPPAGDDGSNVPCPQFAGLALKIRRILRLQMLALQRRLQKDIPRAEW